MPILKQRRERGYTVIPNGVLESKELNLKDIGLLCYLLHLPNDWDFTVAGLVSAISNGKADGVKDKRDGIMASLARIEKAGYLSRKRNRDDGGKYTDTVWTISDSPMSDSPKSDFPTLVEPTSAKPQQINTNSTKEKSDTNTYKEKRVTVDAAPLTPQGERADDSHISFPYVSITGGKETMNRRKLAALFGESLTTEAIQRVNWYVNHLYPKYRGKAHEHVAESAKPQYAYRLLRMLAELELDDFDLVDKVMIQAVRYERKLDPMIYLVTSPVALGYWIIETKELGYESIAKTRYDLNENDRTDEPFDRKCADGLRERWENCA